MSASPAALPARLAAGPAARAAAVPAGVAALVAVSALLRTRALDAAYWMDEGISLGIAAHPLTAIPGLLREDGSPPLFYLLLHVWTAVAGRSEPATHTLSLVIALGCVPVAWWMARTLWGARAGWAAAALAALSPPLTYHAQETRMYPLVVLLSLLVAGSWAGAFLEDRPRMAWLHAGALTLLAYTHDWFGFLAAAEALATAAVVVAARGRRRALLVRAAIAFALPAVLYAPWAPTLLFQARHTGAPWSAVPTLRSLWGARTALLVSPAAVTAVAIAGAGAVLVLWRRRRGEAVQLAALAWLAAGTLALAWLASQHTPAWSDRYETIALGPLLLLTALAIARLGVVGAVALVVIVLAWVHQPPLDAIARKSNAAAITARVAPRLGHGDLVLDAVPESVPVVYHYLGPGLRYASSLGPVADPGVMDWRDALARLRAAPPRRVLRLADRLAPGARVALFLPPHHARYANAWEELIRERGRTLAAGLRRDPRFRRVARLGPGFHGPKTTLRAQVFARLP